MHFISWHFFLNFATNLGIYFEASFDCYLSDESIVGRFGGSGKEKCEVITAVIMQHCLLRYGVI